MSIREVIFRSYRFLSLHLSRYRSTSGSIPDVPDVIHPLKVCKLWLKPSENIESTGYIQSADKILSGQYDIFALHGFQLGMPPQWNCDPKTGIHAPLEFGMTLDYRSETLVGDIKYLWEPNRHLELVTLCQAYYLTRDSRYLNGFEILCSSWLVQCPYPLGPNWSSSLEAGIRLINWSICWCLIGGANSSLFETATGDKFRTRWLQSIWIHCHFITKNWSRFSSANNHLIGEASGLFVASVTWPLWQQSPRWSKDSIHILQREAALQVFDDGVLKEQAVSYIQFVADFMLISGLVGKQSGLEFGDQYWKVFEGMIDFLASIMDCSGNVPMIGDADDGFVVRLSTEPSFCNYQSLLATGSILLNRDELLQKAGYVDDKTKWLMGAKIADFTLGSRSVELQSHYPIYSDFASGGYYILGSDWGTESEIRLIADAGSLGYLSIAAHGHADALSFTLSVGGNEFLIDPGTFAYHTERVWRDYFRGTSAHNTVCVDGIDQSVSGGNFMWLHHANARVIERSKTSNTFILEAEHDGYQRLNDPLVHRRRWSFDKTERVFQIIDTFDCHGTHRIDRWWHFSENCEIKISTNSVEAVNGRNRIQLMFDKDLHANIVHHRGSSHEPAGWVSRHFDVKVVSSSICEHINIHGSTQITAYIRCD
ncbi:heparinase II/III family protein [Thiocapsa imhoffii]|nr:alginate lyase family protein [Thiocapsa imhoffii]